MPGVISSLSALNDVYFKTIIGTVTKYDEPKSPDQQPPSLESLSLHYWYVKPGEVDNQKPHLQDEIYIIMEGVGQVDVNGEVSDISRGDIIFVPAKMPHHFISHKVQTMKILILFAPNWDGENP